MMNNFKILISLVLSSCLLFASCVDADIDDAVEYDDYYQSVDDADAAIIGLYGKFMELAAPVVVLNELRGDLIDITENTPEELRQVNRHESVEGNSWTDVTQFYNIIANCNDILYNFDKMKKENKLTEDEYNERYSDVGALRTWVYYQLGVHYGKVRYVTDPIVDLRDFYSNEIPELTLDNLLPELISFMESLPTLENYVNSKLIENTVDGYDLATYFVPKKVLLGDLYLFNDQFLEAATIYREVLAVGEDLDATDLISTMKYKLYTQLSWTSGEVNYFAILFHRYKPDDVTTYYNAWKNMFSIEASSRYAQFEWIWEISYDYQFAPTYPFVELFANTGKGKYYLKPSDYSINELWNHQQKNGYPYDARGLTSGIEESNGRYVVSKYLADYDAIDGAFQQQGKWFLYRAGVLHLRYAEAANRCGYPLLAYALMNNGIGSEIAGVYRWTREDGTVYRGDSVNISSYGPGQPYPQPFYFDGRSSDTPYLRSPWRYNVGVRTRANMPNLDISDCTTTADSIAKIEKLLLNEGALEYGFEGHRWTDMIRIARRMEKEVAGSGSAYLTELMSGKFRYSGETAPDLSSPDKWYLKMYE